MESRQKVPKNMFFDEKKKCGYVLCRHVANFQYFVMIIFLRTQIDPNVTNMALILHESDQEILYLKIVTPIFFLPFLSSQIYLIGNLKCCQLLKNRFLPLFQTTNYSIKKLQK